MGYAASGAAGAGVANGAAGGEQGAFSEMYRTESPMQFATATGAYEVEQHQQEGQGMFGLGDHSGAAAAAVAANGYAAHPLDAGYYSSMTHHAVAL